MIADTGDIEKVRGRRMATPLAPPRPGQHPDQHAEEDADEHVDDVHRVGENAEAVDQRREGFQELLPGRRLRRCL